MIVWEGFAGGCRPRWGGWGGDDNDNDPRGNDDVNDVRLYPPRPHNNKPFGQGEGGPFGRGEGGERLLWTRIFKGGLVTPPTRRRSGDTNGEGEGAGEGEGDAENGRRRQRRGSEDNNDGGGGGGDGRRRQSGHHSPDNRDNGDVGDVDDNDPIERL